MSRVLYRCLDFTSLEGACPDGMSVVCGDASFVKGGAAEALAPEIATTLIGASTELNYSLNDTWAS